MAIKYREAEELRQTTRQNLARSVENWTRFLKTAGNTYKYNYSDQLLISAQFPNATAVASFDLWSERFGRRIKSGQKGIGLIDTSGSHPKVKYVFDISQSTANPNIPQPQVWQLGDDYKNVVAFDLSSDTNYSIENAISDLAENTVDETLNQYLDDIFANQSKSTMLAGLDEDTIRVQFRELIFDSVKYTAFNRCGLEVDDGDMFRNLYNFSDLPISDTVGSAVSELSGIVLREIESRVRKFERSNSNERGFNQSNKRDTVSSEQRGQQVLPDSDNRQADRFDVQARSTNIPVFSVSDNRRGREGHRDLGQEKREVSQREQADTVYGNVRQSHADGLSDRTQSAGRSDVGYDNGKSGERVGRDRGTESTRPNGMGTQGKSGSNDSGRTSEDRPDLRITEQSNIPTPKTEDKQSPVFFNTTQGEQLGIFPSEHNATVTSIDELLDNIPENAELPTTDDVFEATNDVYKVFTYGLPNDAPSPKTNGVIEKAETYKTFDEAMQASKAYLKQGCEGTAILNTNKKQIEYYDGKYFPPVSSVFDDDVIERSKQAYEEHEERFHKKYRYKVYTYSEDSGLDNKPEFATISEAKREGEYHIKLGSDGFAVINTQKNRVEAFGGKFPDSYHKGFNEDIMKNSKDVYEKYFNHPIKFENPIFFNYLKDEWFSESSLLKDFEKNYPHTISFALANAIVEYLDEKKHAEQGSGYDKTDFYFLAYIDGEPFRYDGRIDIGMGKGRGGGSLIDHIRDVNESIVQSPFYPYNQPKEKEKAQKILDVLVPFLETRTDLDKTEQEYFDNFKKQHPIQTPEMLEQKQAEQAEKEILSSDGKQEQEELPKTLEQENNQNETVGEQDVVQYTVNFVTQSETYAGGYDSDGHERLDNYSLQQDETSFRIYTDYVSKYDSNLPYGYYDIGTEQAIEEINKLLDGDDVQVQITDKNNNTVSIDDVLSYLKERAVSAEQENLTDKEIAFKDCDIVSILAEAEFNADDVERLGKIFFDDGYTEKNPASENTYGLGLGEERIYELAEKRKNGEDIAKEFVSELLDKQSSHLSFAVDDNPENSIDCSVELNDNGVKITYGNVVRDVAYADLFNHCMDLFQKDHNNVLQHRQAELTREKNKEIIDSLTVGSQIILPENSWEVTHINGDFSANLSNLDENSKMSDLSYMGRWKEGLLDEAKDQPIIVITPKLAQQLKDVVAKTSEYYGMLYDLSDNVDNYNLALEQGEMFINDNIGLVNHLNKMRGDILSSDREVAAFGFALADVGLIEDFLLVEEFENAEKVDEELEQPKEEQGILSSTGKEEQAEVKTSLSREELIEKAKNLINDFVNEEYDNTKGADFSDLTKIDVAYTTTEDEKHTIQAYIDLEHLNIVKEVDGHILEKENYDSLEKLVDDLNSLDFSDLTSISDEQLEKLEQENLTDKDEQPKRINADDIKIGDKFEYKGREYEVTHMSGVYPDDVGVSYIDRTSNGLAYEVTSNINKYTLAHQGQYLGNIQQEELQPEPIEQTEQAKDFAISDMALGQTKLSERFLNNLSAIRTLKRIEAENREATPEEQETLSKYAGWGGLAKVFNPENKHYSEVKELLTEDEFNAARQSTLTAFYTSPVIIKEMYSKLSEMGFTDGKLLEPSCGVGNFIGMIPENMNAKVSGVELDSLTGRIAQKLYPNANIQVCGFENAKLKDNSFDVAVGNVPFGEFSIYDKKYNKDKLLIHDYFFSKSLDMVKSGGVVAFITSKGTLDKLDKKARTTLAEKAEFLGAVRLPNTAFKSNAGTEVTSDIIFLQKRENPIAITPENEPLWLKTAKDENGIEMNAYFAENPQQICGKMEMVSSQHGMTSTCQPNLDTKLSEQIRSAMANINGTISTAKVEAEQKIETPLDNVEVPDNLRNSSYFLSNGKAYFFETDNITPVEFPKSRAKQSLERLSGMIAIRDTVRQLLDMQIDEHTTDDEIKAVQSTLSSLYDGFVQKHGRLNDVKNTSVFKKDSSLPLLKSLEKTNQKGEFIGKADIFSKRTVKAQKIISSVENAVDALAVSISEKAEVNLDYMSDLTGMDKGKLIGDLQGLIYRLPNTETYVTADEYLSGDILEKLNAAKIAFDNGDTSMAVNISALEKAMPERLSASQIDVRLGTTWIKPEYIRDFVYDLLKTPSWNKSEYNPKELIDVEYSQETGRWNISNKSANKSNALATTTYGTAFKSAYELIEDMLNLRSLTVKDRIEEDGKIKEVTNREKTAIIYSKAELIEQKFEEWIFEDKARRDDLVNTYNETFNSIRPREYDGSHLNFVGMNPEISLRPHQLNAVARCLYGGNTLLAHEVGAGKTFEMIAACMEGKRLGLHSKSLFCVPNHLTEQIGLDFLKLYPNANILVATHKDFEKENRQKLVAKIATGNYDAVIIGHSQLKRIPVSPEKQEEFIRNQLNQLELGIMELKGKGGFQVKELERSKKSLEEKLNKLLNAPKKDEDNITFEQLGIDKLFLDEAHEFKNLFLTTKMSNIAGITMSSDTQITADLYMKTQYLDEITGGKGIVFATGTPISNSMCEMYNMQKYLQSDLLKRKNLFHFDSWATTFGDKVTKLELATEGGYQAKTRFSQFHNLPELMSMFKECADIQTADTLNLPNLPECEIHNVVVQPTEQQKEFVKSLAERATLVHNRAVPPTEDNMLKITTDGKLLGLDQRLINPDLPDEPQTKVNMCVENVFGIWNKTQEQKSTQLIFCDTSTPSGHNSFNLYDDIKNKLVAKGVPENEIEFIHSAKTEDAKEKLFAKVRAGDVRILIGSTKKMGAGTNVQTKLIASHDLDAPYRPSDMEQRRGRMVRQGNENPKVDLYRYCTQDTFDAYLFQMLERKQNFISQVMTSKSPQRKCDDMDEATLSYAEVKALCIGDPRIKEKMELDIDVAKLQLERKAYRDEQYSMEDKIDRLQKRVKGFEISIPKNESDFLYYENNHQPVFDEKGKKVFEGITINGKTYTERKEANEALKNAYINACRQGGGYKDFVSAHCEYKGFNLSVMFDSFSKCYKARLEREGEYYFDLGTDNIGRMDNVLDKLKDQCKDKVARCAECKKAIEDINENLGKPFPKEQEFLKKTARLAQLNAELDTKGKKDEMGGLESELGDNLTQGNKPKR